MSGRCHFLVLFYREAGPSRPYHRTWPVRLRPVPSLQTRSCLRGDSNSFSLYSDDGVLQINIPENMATGVTPRFKSPGLPVFYVLSFQC